MSLPKIPFYPNSKDNLRCLQASLKMALSALVPSTKYSHAALDEITGYKRDKLTWDIKALLWFASHNFNVKKISTFDYQAFADRGRHYVKDFWRPDVYELQKSQSNLYTEQQRARKLVEMKNVELIRKRPTLALLEKHISAGWLAIIHIDVSRFDKTRNYSPHSIVVIRINSTAVFFHDPGMPPEMNRRVGRKKFADALSDGELILIKADA